MKNLTQFVEKLQALTEQSADIEINPKQDEDKTVICIVRNGDVVSVRICGSILDQAKLMLRIIADNDDLCNAMNFLAMLEKITSDN